MTGTSGPSLAPDARAAWSDLLLHRCGLALRDAQVPVLAAAVEERAAALGVRSGARYMELLQAEDDTGAEWTELIERLVSHETSFFRHPESFDALGSRLLPGLRRRPDVGAAPLQLCSAGCSTGEEAYSIAMVALAEPTIGGDFTVWGMDISRRSIEAARAGRYGARAVAAVPDRHRPHLSRVNGNAWQVTDALRERTRFVPANLLASCGVFVNYDLIVCQNVLIYFAPSAVHRLLSLLAGRLTLGGYLLLGPGEAPAEGAPGLEAVNVKGVRAFRRVARAAREVSV